MAKRRYACRLPEKVRCMVASREGMVPRCRARPEAGSMSTAGALSRVAVMVGLPAHPLRHPLASPRWAKLRRSCTSWLIEVAFGVRRSLNDSSPVPLDAVMVARRPHVPHSVSSSPSMVRKCLVSSAWVGEGRGTLERVGYRALIWMRRFSSPRCFLVAVKEFHTSTGLPFSPSLPIPPVHSPANRFLSNWREKLREANATSSLSKL